MCKLTNCQKSLLVLGLLFFGLLGTVRVSSALDVGDTAPDFTLPATTGGKISLSGESIDQDGRLQQVRGTECANSWNQLQHSFFAEDVRRFAEVALSALE